MIFTNLYMIMALEFGCMKKIIHMISIILIGWKAVKTIPVPKDGDCRQKKISRHSFQIKHSIRILGTMVFIIRIHIQGIYPNTRKKLFMEQSMVKKLFI